MKNKNLLYLILAIIVGGVVAYVTNRQNEKYKKEQDELVKNSIESMHLFDKSDKALKELSDSIDDFGKQIRKDREELQNRIKRLTEEQAEVQSELLEYVNKKDAE